MVYYMHFVFKFSQSSRNRVSKLEFTHDFLKGWHLKGYAVSTCVYMKGEVNRQTAFHGKRKKNQKQPMDRNCSAPARKLKLDKARS